MLLLGTTSQGTQSAASGYVYYYRNEALATGDIVEVQVYSTASTNVRVAIYSDVSTLPNTLLAESASTPVTANEWNVIPISLSVTQGTFYWLALQTEVTDGGRAFAHAGDQAEAQVYGVFPATASPFSNAFGVAAGAYSADEINASLDVSSLFSFSGTMINGAIGDINAALPISFSLNGTVDVPTAINAALPVSFTLSGTMTAPLSTINAALPLSFSLNSTMRFGNDIAAALPITLGMSGTMYSSLEGGVLYVTNPMQEVSFTGILDCIGSFNFETPMSLITIEGHIDEVGSFNIAVPAMEISLTGLTGQIGDLTVRTPMQVFTATGIVSETGDLTVTTPMMKLVFTGAQDVIVSALALTVPMQEISFTGILSPFGTLSLVVPMMEITFKGLPASYLSMVLNLRNQGLTEYTNYDFNSLCRFRGRHLAATSTGVYELDSGETDDGDQIDWNIRTGYMDTEQKEKLRLRQAWVSYKSNGDLIMTVILPDGSEYEYDLEGYDVTENGVRVKFGKGIRSKYVALDLKNVDGSSLTLDAIKLHLDKTGLVR